MQLYFIGVNGRNAVSSQETKKQIEEIKKITCELIHEGEKIDWSYFDNPKNKHALFIKVLHDKITRVDNKNILDTRPNFCVITVLPPISPLHKGEYKGVAVRLEYYEGYGVLKLTYDYRSQELLDKDLPEYMLINYNDSVSDYLKKVNSLNDLIEYNAQIINGMIKKE